MINGNSRDGPDCQLTRMNQLSEPLSSSQKLWQLRTRAKRIIKRRITFFTNTIREQIKSSESNSTRAAVNDLDGKPLQAGDWVRIKSKEEIKATLGPWNDLKGCAFMEEMWRYCETTHQVLKPMERFLDERDYRVKKVQRTVILEHVNCQGTVDFGPCDRNCFFFWREEWLRTIDGNDSRLQMVPVEKPLNEENDLLNSRKTSEPISVRQFKFRISESISDPEWDTFLANTPNGHHVQSSLWAQVKAFLNWKSIRIIVNNNDQIVAGAQLLFRTIALSNSVMYLPKGPVLAFPDMSLAEQIIQEVVKLSRQYRAQLLVVQPPNDGTEIASRLPSMGFEASRLELAPVASLVIDLDPSLDQIVATMKRQTRQNIRRGEQAGLVVREGNECDLDTFYEFHKATCGRQGFPIYSKEYYLRFWKLFEPYHYIKLLISEYKDKPISGLLLIPFGEVVVAKILGWSGEYPELRPNDAMFMNAIRWSKCCGYKFFDFEGISVDAAKAVLATGSLPENFQHSPDFFKLGYGGSVVLYPEAYEILYNPVLRWVYKKATVEVGGSSFASKVMDKLRKT